ncbi:YbaK/EbsC family protein [Sphingomonas morindae]|uniref:YbaK/EbsC family protein n=1 Tax=Sphingomonas morindae TaxID=1541170 RepID=A0ABY4X830_9SPHN|nr:YbaK/EbsC family protein [Sphingomonas morindae]USI73109.1 YbaK/EbsC family protein [Sphingomonas morindae]
MSLASVIDDLARRAPDLRVRISETSTATVAEAAATLGVEPGRIAKTIALAVAGAPLLLVTRGDARLDNGLAKAAFGGRPRMLDAETVLALTSHPVGGVCPFGLPGPVPIWLDTSLRDFETLFPAAGDRTASVELSPERLAALTGGLWVRACTLSSATGVATAS